MKKVIISAILFFRVVNGYTQQEFQDKEVIVMQTSDKVLAAKLAELFDQLGVNVETIKRVSGIKSFYREDFDFINLYKSYVKGQPGLAICARYKGESGNAEFAFSIFQDKDNYFKPVLVKTFKDRSMLGYYDLTEGSILTVSKVNDSYKYSNTFEKFTGTSAKRSCGQAVIDCVANAYTNHGWVSVWATIQSIFVPATTVGIVAGCIIKSCPR